MENVIQFNQVKKDPVCSFCKKPKSAVPMLIGEPGRPYICSLCVEKCSALIIESDKKELPSHDPA